MEGAESSILPNEAGARPCAVAVCSLFLEEFSLSLPEFEELSCL